MTALQRRFRRACVTAGLVFVAMLAACEADRDLLDQSPPDPATIPADPAPTLASTEDSIRDAAIDFIRAQTAVPDAVVHVEAIEDDWARARLEPPDGLTDPAVMYLQRTGNGWRGVTIGTAFLPDELEQMGVAPGVRPE